MTWLIGVRPAVDLSWKALVYVVAAEYPAGTQKYSTYHSYNGTDFYKTYKASHQEDFGCATTIL